MTPVLYALLALAMALSTVRFFQTEERAEQSARIVFAKAVGAVLGREIALALPDGGALAVVRLPPVFTEGALEIFDAELEGLRSSLDPARYPMQIVNMPDSPGSEELEISIMSEAEYRGLLNQVSGVKAVVLQRAVFDPAARSEPSTFPPAFLLLGEGNPVDRLVREGFVLAAVEHRSDGDFSRTPSRGMSAQEVFDLRYRIARP